MIERRSGKVEHWRKSFNPHYLGSWDFQDGEEKVVIIKSVEHETVRNTDGKEEEKLVLHLEVGIKPYILNKTNCRTIARLHGTPDINQWPGKGLIMYVSKVPAFGELVDAVRIRPVKPYECAACGGYIVGYRGKSHAEIRNYTREKYGRQLCAACAEKEAAGKPAATGKPTAGRKQS